ncbi:MAG: carbamoyl phosphate synthase large subunit [Acidobacteria bacterium RBG_13_68_16]|nr:MAG: carbamoyl phosphate synthase large subunit [Acidobacteria bacterium RBG_13_68_16]
MPRRDDLRSVCVLGAGPIRIGQACEFDYSGVQGVQALREEGLRVVLVNSNPATIMTDPERADATYIEPITATVVAAILEKERCDALLPTLGGQTALNVAVELANSGVLERLSVRLLGAGVDAIRTAEDRERFREAMRRTGLPVLPSLTVTSLARAEAAADVVGFPAILRPSFTLGGTGTAMVYNREEYGRAIKAALAASPVGEVLVERSVEGWKEFELEVMRDVADTVVVVCSIENVDAMGVHTGDSITVAPALTLTDKEYQVLRDAAATCLKTVGVETGGANVQFAVRPETGEWAIIEMNPRVSRSSALASKATGFPIARIAAKLALGYRLDEITNAITGSTPASFEPALDYVVVKVPRFAFEKFPGADDTLGTAMKSVGEAMAIGTCFEEALLKAVRSLELGRAGLAAPPSVGRLDEEGLASRLRIPNPERLWVVAEALRRGWDVDRVSGLSRWDPWFVRRVAGLVAAEAAIADRGLSDAGALAAAKRLGFSDADLARLVGQPEGQVRERRRSAGAVRRYRKVDTCAGEFAASTPYLYGSFGTLDEVPDRKRPAVVILGSGPVRIGQGIEFDACCVQAIAGLRAQGREAVMLNCNPETVSTDWDAADRLYFEPLTLEEALDVITREQAEGAVAQFGGQTPLKLAKGLAAAGVRILGTPPDAIDLAEDRERFSAVLKRLGLRQPACEAVVALGEARNAAARLGYPVLVRPSYVLGGRGMEVVYREGELAEYWEREVLAAPEHPVLIDRFLERAVEVDVDALSDGSEVVICGVLEHIEEAGIHSGDSSCVFPSVSLALEVGAEVRRITRLLARELGVVGLLNLQLAVRDGLVYVLEANPRASRTVPFVSKATGVPWAGMAAQVCCGARLSDLGVVDGVPLGVAVKMPVFPFDRFPGVDPLPGPEMRSTGEVMGMAGSFGEAYAKAAQGAGLALPPAGTVFLSVADADKPRATPLAARLQELGLNLLATQGTAAALARDGIKTDIVRKVSEGRPHVVDLMVNGEIQMVINTASGSRAHRDGIAIRRGALEHRIPYVATVAGAFAAAEAIAALRGSGVEPRSLQEWQARADAQRLAASRAANR